MRHWILGLSILLGGCQANPQQKPFDDPEVIAALEEAQRRIPPFKALAPEQLSPGDFTQMDDNGGSCAFYLDSAPDARALLVTRPNFGWIKLEGQLLRLGVVKRSAAGPFGTRIQYLGRQLDLRLEPSEPDQAAPAGERQIIPGQIVINDAWGRAVFVAAGKLRCAAQ
ncbi:MAG: hypothetical protein ABL914_00030 [Novosphingobium sp.]|uniref:hypothetical protein n=1 Tax=Novosphingobium sp. TaxID=1874826 RepID=UPI0032BBBB08